MQPLELLTAFVAPLEKSGIPYFITGSVASIFYGEPRLTHDIDIVIHLSKIDLSRFSSFFPLEQYYCPPEEVIQIETKRPSLRPLQFDSPRKRTESRHLSGRR
jgi:hypothetical protein